MRRRLSGTTLLIVAGCCSFWGLLGGPVLIHAYKNDFLCYYVGGTLARQRRFADLYRPAAQVEVQERVAPDVKEPRPYVRPPWFAVGLAPLTSLPLVHAYAVWIGTILIILLGTWMWAFARFGERAVIWAALFLPTNLGLCFGQDCAVMLAVLCLFYVLWKREENFLSGMALGIGLVKPHLLLVFPVWMILQKRWRMLAGFAAVSAILLAASLLLLGPSGLAGYAHLLLHGKTDLGPSPNSMLNIYSLPANFGIASRPLSLFLAALVVGLAIFGLRRAPGWRAIGIASASSLLISPHVFGYDAALLLLPIWLVLVHSASKFSRYSAVGLCVPVTFLFTLAHRPLPGIPALAVLVFLIALVADTTEQESWQEQALGARANVSSGM